MEQQSLQKRPQELVIPFLVTVGIGNALMVPIATWERGGPFLAVVWSGVICAQVALVSAWIALWSAGLAWRVVMGSATGLVLFGAWLLGVTAIELTNNHGDNDQYASFVINCLLIMPLISLAAQTPFWFIRIALRWRIVQSHTPHRTHVEHPLAIRDLLAGTAAIAVVISLARLARALPLEPESTMMMELLVAAGTVAILTTATTLPLTIVIFSSREPGRGCAVTLALYGILLLASTIVFAVMTGIGTPREVIAFPLTSMGAFLVTQAGILLVARSHGVQMLSTTSCPAANATKASPPDTGA